MIYRRGDVESRYIPKGSQKVADRRSDAVAYLYDSGSGVPFAIAYSGKRNKPDWHFRFRSTADRSKRVAEHFAGRQASLEAKKRYKANRTAHGRRLQVGNILRTCWGYDQTNVEFFQVTALVGSTMVEVREIAQSVRDTGWCQHDVAPVPDEFVGPPLRRKVSGYDGLSCRIDDVRHASLHGTGVARATSYA